MYLLATSLSQVTANKSPYSLLVARATLVEWKEYKWVYQKQKDRLSRYFCLLALPPWASLVASIPNGDFSIEELLWRKDN